MRNKKKNRKTKKIRKKKWHNKIGNAGVCVGVGVDVGASYPMLPGKAAAATGCGMKGDPRTQQQQQQQPKFINDKRLILEFCVKFIIIIFF